MRTEQMPTEIKVQRQKLEPTEVGWASGWRYLKGRQLGGIKAAEEQLQRLFPQKNRQEMSTGRNIRGLQQMRRKKTMDGGTVRAGRSDVVQSQAILPRQIAP
jgi:hypothetical protein